MNMLEVVVGTSLYFTLMAAVATVPLLIVVLLVDQTVGRRMAPAFRSLLWTLVAVRMLVPIALPNTLGVPNLWWAVIEGESPHQAQGGTQSTVQRQANSPPVIPSINVVGATGADLTMPPTRDKSFPTTQPTPPSWRWERLVVLGIISLWPLGAMALLGRAVIGSVRFATRLRRIPAVSDPAVIDLLAEVCRTMLIARVPRVKYVPGLSAPALFGCLRPTLCLPTAERQLPREQLRMVLLHELGHLTRYDGYVAWLLVVVQSVHWFNPLAWFVTRQVAHTRELACDEVVRRFTATSEHRMYGDLIVQFASAKPSVHLGLVGLWFARPIRRLKSRVEACTPELTRRWRVPRLLSIFVVAIVACLGFTDRAPSKVVEPPSPPQVAPASPEVVAAAEKAMARHLDPRPEGAETIEVREYDVSLALAKLTEADPEADAFHWLLTHIRGDGGESPKPALVAANRDSGLITLRMSRHEHAGFAEALEGIERSGAWLIDVEIRFFEVADVQMLGNLRWEEASYATKPFGKLQGLPTVESDGASQAVISMTSTSTAHGSYKTTLLDPGQLQRALANTNRDRRNVTHSAPRVTLFNATGGIVRDEIYAPYLTGSKPSSDPARANEPVISVLSEGSRIELRGVVVDANILELSCRATFSEIDSVHDFGSPGNQHLLQVPRVSQLVFEARGCRFAPGQTLVVAPIARLRERGGPVSSLCFALTPRWSPAMPPRPGAAGEATVYIDETGGEKR